MGWHDIAEGSKLALGSLRSNYPHQSSLVMRLSAPKPFVPGYGAPLHCVAALGTRSGS